MHEGDQLELFTPEEMGEVRVAWEGGSPRALTRGHGLVILKPQAKKRMTDSEVNAQTELWLRRERATWGYQGAPLLVPLRGGNDG